MGKPKPPASPDYAAAATAQGTANVDAARASAQLSNPNMVTPYGNQTVSYNGNIPTVTQTLTPTGQATVDQQQAAGLGLAQTANKQQAAIGDLLSSPFSFGGQLQTSLGQLPPVSYLGGQGGNLANATMPATESHYPGLQQAPAPQSDIQNFITNFRDVAKRANADDVSGAYNPQLKKQFGDLLLQGNMLGLPADENGLFTLPGGTNSNGGINAPPPQSGAPQAGGGINPSAISGGYGALNESQVPQSPINPGMTAQQAIMARLQPALAQQRTSTETQLTNQGLRPGGEAYDNSIRNLGQQENDARTQAVLQGLGLDLSANNQGFNQALQRGTLGLGAQGQQFGQNYDLTNQRFNQGLQYQGAQNAAQNQQFNQALQSGQFGNQSLQQALAMALTQRDLPINEITALLSGSQVQNPAFPGYQGVSSAPSPLFAGTQAQDQYNQNIYQQQVAQRNSLLGGLFSLGGIIPGVGALFAGAPKGAAR